MKPGDAQQLQHVMAAMAESQQLWQSICDGVEDARVEMLIQQMTNHYGLLMHGETNANALMALIGFMSDQVLNISEDGVISLESSMVLMQMCMQKGVQAHLVVMAKKSTT